MHVIKNIQAQKDNPVGFFVLLYKRTTKTFDQ